MKISVTTSWDDGHKLDLRVAALLEKYGLQGTFYICKDYLGSDRLSEDELVFLSRTSEIGAHTLTHPDLARAPLPQVRQELQGSKEWLEKVIGRPVRIFCYPYGSFSEEVKKEAKEVGFEGARTVERYQTRVVDPFQMGTTLNVYPFPFRKLDKGSYFWRYVLQPFFEQYRGLRSMGVPYFRFTSWDSVAKAAFDRTLETGGVFHIWGHSWEIEKYGMWDELEEVLKYISKRSGCDYLTNSEVLDSLKTK